MGYRIMLRNLAAVALNYLDAGIGFFVVAYDPLPARIRGYGVDVPAMLSGRVGK